MSTSSASSLANIVPQQTVRHMRPLYFHEGELYCSRYNKILVTADLGRTFRTVAEIPFDGRAARIGRWSHLVQRVLRMGVFQMRPQQNGNIVFIGRGGLFTLEAGATQARKTFAITRGSRPISLAAGDGGLTVFGEYFRNPDRGEVHVYGTADAGLSWQPVYTFPRGSIRHVHGVSFDRWENCFWICTGDEDHECCLFRASLDFTHVEPVLQGRQLYRYYRLLVAEDFLLTATDTPLERNYICRFDKKTGRLERLQEIENSNFYSCRSGDFFAFSTVAEPSPRNDSRASHLWTCRADDLSQWTRIGSYAIDWPDRFSRLPHVPKALFQYSTLCFPEGEHAGHVLVAHATGLQGCDGSMLCYDLQSPATTRTVPRAA